MVMIYSLVENYCIISSSGEYVQVQMCVHMMIHVFNSSSHRRRRFHHARRNFSDMAQTLHRSNMGLSYHTVLCGAGKNYTFNQCHTPNRTKPGVHSDPFLLGLPISDPLTTEVCLLKIIQQELPVSHVVVVFQYSGWMTCLLISTT